MSYYRRYRSHNKGAVLLAAVMLVSLGAAIFTGLRNGVTEPAPADFEYYPDTMSTEVYTEEVEVYDFSLCYFYSQLDDLDKIVYEIFYDMIMHKDIADYTRSFSIPYSEYREKSGNLYLIYHAMIEDNPELFYLDAVDEARVAISGYSDGVTATVIFTLNPPMENENYMIGAFEYATNKFMEDIDLSASDAEIELQIHDKLIDLVSYDYPVYESDESGLAYTAYGALVDDGFGRNNCAVCSGYSKAFQYLLKRAGIMSVIISGTGTSVTGGIPGAGSHAWNAVLLDGEWYEVDCTWDDPGLERLELDEDTISILESEDAYFASTHYWYNRTTEEMKYLPEDQRYTLEYPIENGVARFCICQESYHEREKDPAEGGGEVFYYLREMLPEAVGTEYGLGL